MITTEECCFRQLVVKSPNQDRAQLRLLFGLARLHVCKSFYNFASSSS